MSTPTAPLPAPVAVARYRSAEARANELIVAARATGFMSDMNADDLAHYVDLMAGAKATLAAAGLLHLVGGA
jgi:hypothetical protein